MNEAIDPSRLSSTEPEQLRSDSDLAERGSASAGRTATVQPVGCTLAAYAAAINLPEESLRRYGITQFMMDGRPALRLPYCDNDGEEAGVRLRLALHEGVVRREGLRWKKGSKPTLYGLRQMRHEPSVTVASSEAECHVLWHHGINAVGLPLDLPWREERDATHLEKFHNILVLAGSDRQQDAIPDWVARSRLQGRVQFVRLHAFENVCAMHAADPGLFQERWQATVLAAQSWRQLDSERREASRREAWGVCAELAQEPSLLDRFAEELKCTGVVGVEREAKLLYLASTSRILDRPVSVAVKGPSSAGKSFLVDHVLRFFPKEAFHALTAMSERALAYGDEPLQNRMLVLYEAEGMSGEWASYLIRSLLSEGEIRYETTEKTPEGIRTRLIERQGPTGLIVTTTRTSLHPENETRLLSLTLADGPEQTRAILQSLGGKGQKFQPEREPWIALQRWIALSETRVVIPYVTKLIERIPPVSVRLRRDIPQLLQLIRAHALLHQAKRDKDGNGHVVATLEGDYGTVYDLVAHTMSEGVRETVPRSVRDTVAAVQLVCEVDGTAMQSRVAHVLGLDKSSAKRRCDRAEECGYILNREGSSGRPARYVLGDPLPEDAMLLPAPASLR